MAFAAMVGALFADHFLTKPAAYQPQGSSGSFAIRVIAKQPDTLTDYGGGQIHTAITLFDVQVADVPNPAIGDRLTVDDIIYAVQSEPTADTNRLIWTLNVRPA